MTDITYLDRRSAREWATMMEKHGAVSPPVRAAARVILAAVEAPALSEELANITENWEELATDTITAALATFAARAAQMEHDLAEARAEVERLASGRPARIIDQAECLDRFRAGTVGMTARTLEAWQRDMYGWYSPNLTGKFGSEEILDRFGPMTILYDPKEES